MSHFADYKLEREGKHTLETTYGFAIYQIEKDQCYIEDIYVIPEFRRTKVATEMADRIEAIAKSRGCKTMLGSVVPSSKGSTQSMKTLLAYGLGLMSSQDNFIWFSKEII